MIVGWLRGQVDPEARAEVRVYADDHDVDAAVRRGRQLRAEIDEAADPIGVLIVADGAHTLTQPAPGGFDPDSIPVQAALDDALAGGDAAALTRLPNTIVGRVAYQVLAGLIEDGPRSAKELYRGAPYGVGYFVGTWLPCERWGYSPQGAHPPVDPDRSRSSARPVPGSRRSHSRWPSRWAARS